METKRLLYSSFPLNNELNGGRQFLTIKINFHNINLSPANNIFYLQHAYTSLTITWKVVKVMSFIVQGVSKTGTGWREGLSGKIEGL